MSLKPVMMMSSNGNTLLALCEGNPPVIDWANIQDIGDMRRNRAHYDVTVMDICIKMWVPEFKAMRRLNFEAFVFWFLTFVLYLLLLVFTKQ